MMTKKSYDSRPLYLQGFTGPTPCKTLPLPHVKHRGDSGGFTYPVQYNIFFILLSFFISSSLILIMYFLDCTSMSESLLIVEKEFIDESNKFYNWRCLRWV